MTQSPATMTAAGHRRLSAVAAARLNAALEQIALKFNDPSLSLVMLARRQNISPRYLQRLLKTSDMSFTSRVNELRLQRAFELLTETRKGKRRISDIAFEVGYSDISYFNRSFRSRFGNTPSRVRVADPGRRPPRGTGGEAIRHPIGDK